MRKKQRPAHASFIHGIGRFVAIVLPVAFTVFVLEQIHAQRMKKVLRAQKGTDMTDRQWAFVMLRYEKSKDQIHVRATGRLVIFFGTLTAVGSAAAVYALAPQPAQSFFLFSMSLIITAIASQAKHNDDRIAEQDLLTEQDEETILGRGKSYNARRRAMRRHKVGTLTGLLRKFSALILYVGIQGGMVFLGIRQSHLTPLQLLQTNDTGLLVSFVLSIVFLIVTFLEVVFVE